MDIDFTEVHEPIIPAKRLELEQYRSIEAFAMTLTHNICIDMWRCKRNDTLSLDIVQAASPTGTPERLLEIKDDIRLMHEIIDSLPNLQRTIMRMKAVSYTHLFGSMARIGQKAMELAREEGIKVGMLRPITSVSYTHLKRQDTHFHVQRRCRQCTGSDHQSVWNESQESSRCV